MGMDSRGKILKILINNDFFNDPDEIRKLALECDYDSSKEDWETKWKRNCVGERTNKLNLDEINNQIIKIVTTFYDFDISDCIGYQSHFHIQHSQNSNVEYFEHIKLHRDSLHKNGYAGLIYLTPNAPKDGGTLIVDGANAKFINIDNVYNRLVCYPSFLIHGINKIFGDCRSNGRLTLVFFFRSDKIMEHR